MNSEMISGFSTHENLVCGFPTYAESRSPRTRTHSSIRITLYYLRVPWTRVIFSQSQAISECGEEEQKNITKTKNWTCFIVSSCAPRLLKTRTIKIFIWKNYSFFYERIPRLLFCFYFLLFAVAVILTIMCTPRSDKIDCVFSVVSCDPVSSFSVKHKSWLVVRNHCFFSVRVGSR